MQTETLYLISRCKSSVLLLELFSPIYVVSHLNLPCCAQQLHCKEEVETFKEKENYLVWDLVNVSRDFFTLPQAPINLMDLEHCRQSGVTATDVKHC